MYTHHTTVPRSTVGTDVPSHCERPGRRRGRRSWGGSVLRRIAAARQLATLPTDLPPCLRSDCRGLIRGIGTGKLIIESVSEHGRKRGFFLFVQVHQPSVWSPVFRGHGTTVGGFYAPMTAHGTEWGVTGYAGLIIAPTRVALNVASIDRDCSFAGGGDGGHGFLLSSICR